MTTRADFYVGRIIDGAVVDHLWLGSVGHDGAPASRNWDALPHSLLNRRAEGTWRRAVAEFLAGRDDATTPPDGWPWSWESSRYTDWAYVFDREAGRVELAYFGRHQGSFQDYRRRQKIREAWLDRRERAASRGVVALAEFDERHPRPDDPEGPRVRFPHMAEPRRAARGWRPGLLFV